MTADARQHTLLRDDLERAGVTIHEQAGTGAVRRRPHRRKRQRAAAAGRQGHPLHRRNLAAAGGSRLRPDRDAQRRVAPFLGAAVAARDRRWRDRRAGGVDLQRVRLTGPPRRGRSPHPDERGPRGLRSRRCRPGRVRRPGRRRTPGRSTASSAVRPACGSSIRPASGQQSIDATLAVVAAGWVAATAGLDLDRAGVQTGPARVRPGGRAVAHDRAARLRRRRRHRARDGRARGGPRGTGGRDQRRPRREPRPCLPR